MWDYRNYILYSINSSFHQDERLLINRALRTEFIAELDSLD